MNNQEQYLRNLYDEIGLKSSKDRRLVLINKMNTLKCEEINCFSCSGDCCTFIANSMQVDPLQTLELYFFLKDSERINDELINSLKDTVGHYRLDYDMDVGSGQLFRRTYTCPFFSEGAKGCSISRTVKPYGCLGFNSSVRDAKGGNVCFSDLDILKERDKLHCGDESAANDIIRQKLNIFWNKLSMPVALLQFIELLKED